MAEHVVVAGVGMMTAVGLSAAETAASVRAGIAMFAETSFRDHRYEPFTLAEVAEHGLAPLHESLAQTRGLTSRETRMLRLATPPLIESLGALAGRDVRPGLMLALPESETTLSLDRGGFLAWLTQQVGDVFDPGRSDATFTGRAGGLLAIDAAAASIRSGRATFALAGGVDTYRDLYLLGTLDMEKRVKSSTHLDGFIPGEGAAFVLLAGETAAARGKLMALASLSPVSAGAEPGHLYSEETYRGDGLAAVVRHLAESGDVAPPVREVYSSMNGEHHWAKEWGVSYIRNRPLFDEEHGMHHPADSFGDTGAASGPLMVGLAALGISAGYFNQPALVYCSSDGGERAALAVS